MIHFSYNPSISFICSCNFEPMYFKREELEEFSRSYSKATSLSYTAGVADLDSVNNFSKDEASEENRDEDSNLQQTKEAITDAKRNLDCIILLLQKS
jgi:hypothetical protein